MTSRATATTVHHDQVSHRIGVMLVLAFTFSQAIRDVYFAGVFQGTSIQAVIVAAFGPSTLVFGLLAMFRRRTGAIDRRGLVRTIVLMGLATAVAWNCYFFALRVLDPVIVNTLHSGVGPFVVLAAAAAGSNLAGHITVGRIERWMLVGVAASLCGLAVLALTGRSGLAAPAREADAAAIGALLVSGTCITVSLMLARRAHDAGLGIAEVTVLRFLVILGIGLAALGTDPSLLPAARWSTWAWLALAGTGLIVLPTIALQAGIVRTPPLTAHVLRSLGPVVLFGFEQVDPRIAFSAQVLACVLAYCVFTLAANLAHIRGR